MSVVVKPISKPYSGGPNLPLGSNGKVDFKSLNYDVYKDNPYRGDGAGYGNFNGGFAFPNLLGVNGGVKVDAHDGTRHYYLGGCLAKPGLSASVTASNSNISRGWSADGSVFASLGLVGAGGSVSNDGSAEGGVGLVGWSGCLNYTW